MDPNTVNQSTTDYAVVRMTELVSTSITGCVMLIVCLALAYLCRRSLQRVFDETGADARLGRRLASFPAWAIAFWAVYIAIKYLCYSLDTVYRLLAPAFLQIDAVAPMVTALLAVTVIIALLAEILGALRAGESE